MSASKKEAENLRREVQLKSKSCTQLSKRTFELGEQLNAARLRRDANAAECESLRVALSDVQTELRRDREVRKKKRYYQKHLYKSTLYVLT